MKQLLSSLLIAFVMFLPNAFSLKANAQADTGTLSGNWILKPVLASDTATGKIPTISFNLLTHTFTGFTGCNNMSGTFASTDQELSFNPKIVLTKKKCTGYNEKEFVANLLRVTAYKIEKGELTLLIGNAPISKWVRKNRPREMARS